MPVLVVSVGVVVVVVAGVVSVAVVVAGVVNVADVAGVANVADVAGNVVTAVVSNLASDGIAVFGGDGCGIGVANIAETLFLI